jgi:mono/diheme cytochrome c family protein
MHLKPLANELNRLTNLSIINQTLNFSRNAILAFLLILQFFVLQSTALLANPNGKEIYQKHCIRCHGDQGQGVKGKNENPLIGTLNREKLAKIINDTMPEEDPTLCVGEEAKLVADYIYSEFYSPASRAGASASRIELTHLTNRQYLHSLADLLSDQQDFYFKDKGVGIKAKYFSKIMKGDQVRQELAKEQLDPTINFDFKEDKPFAEIVQADQFYIVWEGSLIIEDTGDYDFFVSSENGFRFHLNNFETPVIDAYVNTATKVEEHRVTLRLIGGRRYPLKLELLKYHDKTASVKLEWKPPRKAREVIPQRALSQDWVPETFISQTKLPADDKISGYIRGINSSREWDEATTTSSLEAAEFLSDKFSKRDRSQKIEVDKTEKILITLLDLAERAFHRPLSDEDKQRYVKKFFSEGKPLGTSIKQSVISILKSPRFLYPNLNEIEPDNFDIVCRLSLGILDTLPDRHLLQGAKDGWIKKPDEVKREAWRLVSDIRAQSKMRDYFHHWLDIDEREGLTKDESQFPGFDEQVVADLRTSLEYFTQSIVFSEKSDFRDLIISDVVYMNERLANVYDITDITGPEFRPVTFEPEYRSGIVTHPYLMATFAYHKLSSPIHRGIYVTRRLLNRTLKPPPQATEFKDGDFDPHLTTREKVTLLTQPAACQSCHTIINPLGFPMENFDAIGRFRNKEGDRPVDTKTEYIDNEGQSHQFDNADDLAQYVANSNDAASAFVDHLFHHTVKQPINAYGPNVRSQLTSNFQNSGYNIRNLWVEINTLAATHGIKN